MGRINTGGAKKRSGDNIAIASTVAGTTLKLTPPKGYYDGSTGLVTITDGDFIAENIRNGINLFGKVGLLIEGIAIVSENIRASSDASANHTGSTLSEKKKEIRSEVNGNVKIKFELFAISPQISGVIYKNDVYVNFATQTLGQWDTYSFNIPVVKGDLIQLRLQGSVSSSDGTVRNFRLCYDYNVPNSTVLL